MILLSLLLACEDPFPLDDLLTPAHVQVKGTHNSYHLEPSSDPFDEWGYSHAPLGQQLRDQGVRQFELDVHVNADTGALEVFHIPGVDAGTTCLLLADCLAEIATFSDEHPRHLPLWVHIEPKDDIDPISMLGDYAELQRVLRAGLGERLIEPDEVRGAHPTLRDALATGWPTLAETRGRTFVILLDGGQHRDALLEDHPNLSGSALFAEGGAADAYAAFSRRDDPVSDAAEISADLAAGLMVRSRADSDPNDPEGDGTRRQAALESGAQALSTDFPAGGGPNGYGFEIPGGTPGRCNPVTAPAECTEAALAE